MTNEIHNSFELDLKEKSETINKLNIKIQQIIKTVDVDLQSCFRSKLITPLWSLSKESINRTIIHYESIMGEIISIQLKNVDFKTSHVVRRNTTINHIADILIILSFTLAFYEDDDIEGSF